MGQFGTMSSSNIQQVPKKKSSSFHAKTLEEIKNSIQQFEVARPNQSIDYVGFLMSNGFNEESSKRALQQSRGNIDMALEILRRHEGHSVVENDNGAPPALPPRSYQLEPPPRVPSHSTVASSSKQEMLYIGGDHQMATRKYSPGSGNDDSGGPPPLPPPRGAPQPPPTPPRGSTPPPLPPPSIAQYPNVNGNSVLMRRISPVPVYPSARSSTVTPVGNHRGTSPVAGNPLRVTNSLEIQQNFQQQLQTMQTMSSVFPLDGTSEPPPPYPMGTAASNPPPPPPSYSQSVGLRQSPTLSCTSSDYRALDFRSSPAALPYQMMPNGNSPVPSPASSMMSTSSRSSMQAWSARQAKTHSPVIMQSVKSTQVQKPVLQTATPIAPSPVDSQLPQASQASSVFHGIIRTTPVPENCTPPPPPSYEFSIQQKQQRQLPITPSPSPALLTASSPLSVQRTLSPSVTDSSGLMLPPPPPYRSSAVSAQVSESGASQQMVSGSKPVSSKGGPQIQMAKVVPNNNSLVRTIEAKPPLQRKLSPMMSETGSSASRSESPLSDSQTVSASSPHSFSVDSNSQVTTATSSSIDYESASSSPPSSGDKEHHTSPKPERKHLSQAKEEARQQSLIKNCPPSAFKFFMEQHIENVIKEYDRRRQRLMRLEKELVQFGIKDPHMREQMRMVLRRKETNYLRMKRAKLSRKDFKKIKTIGIGAFGEVSLVRSVINGTKPGGLYAMKTLKKSVVVERKQVAHVIAEKDILAEADIEWIVKLYYSFQDRDNLYFVMEYIPGGDLMSMLIKEGRFTEDLARFYIAELTCAVESVHDMGFIHRDIKPDNILIDAAGHIKLTDFGLCTGFRWTHNSEYYHNKNGNHYRQDSMDPINMKDLENGGCSCPHVANGMKPLERRRRKQMQRCMAHSLVGTPNYIAPEVLLKQGYTQSCDWWSVGVILYEMIIGQPPFFSETTINTQAKVIRWRDTLHIPPNFISHVAENMIRGLITDPERRLGSQFGAEELKKHPFLKGIDFSKSLRLQRAPWRPEILHETDTSNFDPIDPERLGNDRSGSEDDESSLKDNHGFYEFTFRRFFDDGGHPLPLSDPVMSRAGNSSIAPDPVYV